MNRVAAHSLIERISVALLTRAVVEREEIGRDVDLACEGEGLLARAGKLRLPNPEDEYGYIQTKSARLKATKSD